MTGSRPAASGPQAAGARLTCSLDSSFSNAVSGDRPEESELPLQYGFESSFSLSRGALTPVCSRKSAMPWAEEALVLDPLITAIAVSVGAASRSRSNLDASERASAHVEYGSGFDAGLLQGLRRIVPRVAKVVAVLSGQRATGRSEPEAVGECRDVSLASQITPNNSDPVSVEPATLCWLASGDAKVIGGRP